MSFVIPYLEKDSPEQAAERVVQEATQAWRKVLDYRLCCRIVQPEMTLLVQLYSYEI